MSEQSALSLAELTALLFLRKGRNSSGNQTTEIGDLKESEECWKFGNLEIEEFIYFHSVIHIFMLRVMPRTVFGDGVLYTEFISVHPLFNFHIFHCSNCSYIVLFQVLFSFSNTALTHSLTHSLLPSNERAGLNKTKVFPSGSHFPINQI